ncbi:hypothetical protein J2T55_002121 [Methylohalomonas lacus]|uniref:Phasin domain-containing protein n=1 Tax=Methylohalomonas lacus TaxID=398773 RepID=A0AAE3L4M2_9GAMM|nr:hypothetical protein [Methylohalomonas lacus]MCS3904088.1 hypothetical protein [Methylohalomonas lacus]
MNKEIEEEAAVWQQFYQSWLKLLGADMVIDSVDRWQTDMVNGVESAMEPAWQLPLRWLNDVKRIVEAGELPEPVQTMALQNIQIGKTGLEIAQSYNASCLHAAATLQIDAEKASQYWLGSAGATQSTGPNTADDILSTTHSENDGKSDAAEAQDIDVLPDTGAHESRPAARRTRKTTRRTEADQGQAIPASVSL